MIKKSFLLVALTFLLASISFSQGDIRKVDFQNFSYMPFCAGEKPQKVKVKDGEYSFEKQEDGFTDRFYFSVEKPVFGDVTGDKKEEAIISSNCNTGGTGQFTEGFIYTIKAGKPALLARIPGGDRAYGGIRSIKAEGGLIVVDQNDVGEAGGACCPEFAVISKHKLVGSKLSLVGKPVRRELYPKQKVSFAAGASKATLKISVDEIKRFSVGAKAGQTLRVSFTSENAESVYLSLIESDDAEITEGTNSLTAKLNKTGNYTIQVQNNYKLPSDVILTIEIR